MQTACLSSTEDSLLNCTMQRADYSDQFQILLKDLDGSVDLRALAEALLNYTPVWCRLLMRFRNQIAPLLGIRPMSASSLKNIKESAIADECKLGALQVYYFDGNYMLPGYDDKHLNFRIRLQLNEEASPTPAKSFSIGTSVRFNNTLGKIYFLVVRPIHRFIVKTVVLKMVRNINGTSIGVHEIP